jgi:FKBP-type peptidyl-prolyl cis-trans isomerase FkpA
MKRVVLIFVPMVMLLVACHKEKTLSYDEQLQKDIGIIDMYLSDNHITAEQDASGLRYVITVPGTGNKPSATSKITIQFIGRLLSNHEIFDQTTKPVTVNLTDEIPGWIIAFPLIPKGSRATLYVPSGLAFGSAGAAGAVPPNANLIYEVELIDDDVKLQNDIAAIDKYLADSAIVAVHDPSGIRYVITTLGTGTKPTLTNLVSFKYAGKLLINNHVFSQPTNVVSYPMNSLMEGLQIGLQFLPSGSKATFYIPSGLAYAANGTDDQVIPPDANLIFDIELISVQ